ncbi:DUF1127 domain-containing protein [Ruegeria sp. R14_0]|uniref:DUF1127 domain-containing protein n=1 Tax=Ruegeria sp. R14_0 TaxID=2821100 RepID=UPI001ADBEEB9|nr:DUF1127 domain-containing protein [Ruegeria sp. R14_0]MBO9448541.1 DUF1127 domain-containing protein [Ruegeria sp. R14_0]
MQATQTVTQNRNVFAAMFADYAEARTEHFRRRIFANTVRELEALSDRQLRDIGVPRDEIKQRAYDSVYHGKPYRQ